MTKVVSDIIDLDNDITKHIFGDLDLPDDSVSKNPDVKKSRQKPLSKNDLKRLSLHKR